MLDFEKNFSFPNEIEVKEEVVVYNENLNGDVEAPVSISQKQEGSVDSSYNFRTEYLW